MLFLLLLFLSFGVSLWWFLVVYRKIYPPTMMISFAYQFYTYVMCVSVYFICSIPIIFHIRIYLISFSFSLSSFHLIGLSTRYATLVRCFFHSLWRIENNICISVPITSMWCEISLHWPWPYVTCFTQIHYFRSLFTFYLRTSYWI